MNTTTFNVGDEVIFGRPNGEQTLGRVVRVNRKSLSIEQMGERGTHRIRKAGTKWRVHPSLVRLANGTAPAPKAKRPDVLIIQDLRRVESRLSPENLSWDGERSASQVRAAARRLNAEKRALIAELGREPSFNELWDL